MFIRVSLWLFLLLLLFYVAQPLYIQQTDSKKTSYVVAVMQMCWHHKNREKYAFCAITSHNTSKDDLKIT